MKFIYLIVIALFTITCKPRDSNLLEIDPRSYTENKINLTEIADDLIYIPLDNKLPIGLIYSYKVLNNSIYLSEKNNGIMEFDRSGNFQKKVGSIGRGPGEYLYCMSFTVDEITGLLYVKDRDETIKVYSKSGRYVRSIQLPKCNDGFPFSEVEIFNSRLFVSQFINMGHAEYNWIIIDSLGKLVKEKKNSIPAFPCRSGNSGGTFKFKDNISYWNEYNDTVFTIYPDLDYKTTILFAQGEHRMPRINLEFKSVNDLLSKLNQYFEPQLLLETNEFLVLRYLYKHKLCIVLINKTTQKTFLNYLPNDYSGGILNNFDGGPSFEPLSYFMENDREYMIGVVNSYQIKTCITSNEFKSSAPKYPEKKKDLQKLASSLKETDNPVLMMVRLKK